MTFQINERSAELEAFCKESTGSIWFESAVQRLAERYHGRMPFDQSYADEEHESNAAFREAKKLATADLTAMLSTQPVETQGAEGYERKEK